MNLIETNSVDPIFALVPLVVFLPLLGLFINLIFGKKMTEKMIGAVASLASGAAFVVAVLLELELMKFPEGAIIPFADWIVIHGLNIGWNFRVDTLSVLMMLVVSGVGTLIHIYSIGYMHDDVRHNGDPGRFRRFFVYLNLFIAAMMILVSADNFVMMFVGWEGVGLCSYLLIGFWFEKGVNGTGNAKAAKKAFVVNRIGDFGFLLAIFMIYWFFGSLNFSDVFAKAPEVAAANPGAIFAITLCLLLGVAGKSAQLPLFVWLPDAMAGPTPVSALIHAATMVTAGVYLVAREQALYALVPGAQAIVMWVGVLTALFAATIAVAQFDIKRVLAYSTISQLGFMVAAVGMGATVAGMFHLVTHAFFKALLFLAAGSVILGMEHGAEHGHKGHDNAEDHHNFDPQDMRNMGGLRKKMPVTYWVYVIGALALAGIAPLSGFFSKDEILAAESIYSLPAYILLTIAAFLTAFYMGRQVLMVFFGKPRTGAAEHAHENSALITVPLIILAFLSIVGGGFNLPGSHILETWLEHSLYPAEPGHFLLNVAIISLTVALLGLLLAWAIYGRKPLFENHSPDPVKKMTPGLFNALEHKWWVDELYRAIIIKPYDALAKLLAGPVDQGMIDGTINGLAAAAGQASKGGGKAQNGYVRTYALLMLIGVVAMLIYLVVAV